MIFMVHSSELELWKLAFCRSGLQSCTTESEVHHPRSSIRLNMCILCITLERLGALVATYPPLQSTEAGQSTARAG